MFLFLFELRIRIFNQTKLLDGIYKERSERRGWDYYT